MHHRLFVARQNESDPVACREQRLAQAGDVAVAENAEHSGKERLPDAVALGVLRDEKFDESLRDGQATNSHFHPPR